MKKVFLILLSTFLFGNLCFSQINLEQPLPRDPDLYYGKSDNGITYYVKHNAEPENRAYLRLVVKAGSVFEDDDQKGLAHMCEHMAFNGTENFPKHELVEYLESLGMQFGADLNAYTSFDETVYMIEVPLDSVGFLNKGMQVIYDWAAGVSYETEEINNERGVIIEEWRLGRGAQDRVQRKTFPVMLYNSKYAKRLPIGDTAIIKNCSPDKLRRFYKDWYRPDLEAVIFVGDFDAKKVSEEVKTLFGKIPARKKEREHVYPEIPDHSEILAEVATDKELQYPLLSVLIKHDYHAPETYEGLKQFITYELISGMMNMRIQEINQNPEGPFAYSGTNYSHFLGEKAAFRFFAVPKNDKLLDAVSVVSEELQRAKKFGFTQTELDRQKKAMLSKIKKEYDNRNKTGSDKVVQIYQNNFDLAGMPAWDYAQKYETYQELLPLISSDDINKAVAYLIINNNTVITLTANNNLKVPTSEELVETYKKAFNINLEAYKEENMSEDLLYEQPESGKIQKTSKNDVTGTTTLVLQNGIKVILKPTDFKDNEVLFSAFGEGGYSLYKDHDLISAKNCTDIANACGAGNFNDIQLTKYLADKNVNVYPQISAFSEGFSGKSTVDDFETMLKLVYAYLTEARFDENGLKNYIAKQKVFLENKESNPQAVWQDSLINNIYGHNKLFKAAVLSDLDKIDLKKAEEIYNERFSDPASLTFIFVGNINAEKFNPLIEKYLGGLSSKQKKEKSPEVEINYPAKNKQVYATKGSDPKSLVYTVLTGKAKNDLKNTISLKALSMVLTDSLLDQIREKKQWTYSISARGSFLSDRFDNYLFTTFFSSAPENVDSVNSYIMRISNNMKRVSIPKEEMKKTIEKLKRDHETKMRDNKYWLKQLESMYRTKGKPDFITDYDKYVNELTEKTLMDAAKKFIPNHYFSVILRPEK